jgi:hypothetical protein
VDPICTVSHSSLLPGLSCRPEEREPGLEHPPIVAFADQTLPFTMDTIKTTNIAAMRTSARLVLSMPITSTAWCSLPAYG